MSTPRPSASNSACAPGVVCRTASSTASSMRYITCLKPIQVQMLDPS